VTGWAAAPQGAAVLGGTGVESLSGYPLPAGLSAPISSFENQTIRQVMHLRHGGDAIRVELTNDAGYAAMARAVPLEMLAGLR
jgi:hypothetical protein